MRGVSKPFVPRSTTKPAIDSALSSSLAQTTATSAKGALVIHILLPVST